MADTKGPKGTAAAGIKCPTCKADNTAGAATCAKCGDILPKRAKKGKGEFDDYDGTVGTMSPACVAVPIALLVIFVAILFFTMRGPREGTCAAVRVKIGAAIARYDKAHPNNKMATINIDELMKPDTKGHPYLKDRPTCPIDPSARYDFDSNGNISCSKCGRK